jgi:hypothetical protein
MTDATSDLLQINLILISIYVFCLFYFEMYICSIKKSSTLNVARH